MHVGGSGQIPPICTVSMCDICECRLCPGEWKTWNTDSRKRETIQDCMGGSHASARDMNNDDQ